MPINLNYLFDLNYFGVSLLYRLVFNNKRFKDDNIYENHIFNFDFNTAFDNFILNGMDKIVDIQKIKKVKINCIYTLYRVRIDFRNYPNLKYIDISNCCRLNNLMYMGIPRLFHLNFKYLKTNKNLVYLNCENTDIDTIYVYKNLAYLNYNNSDIKNIEFLDNTDKLKYFGKLKF